MDQVYYLCFSVNKLPDLTLTKYSVYDGSSVENIMSKHEVFLRQLHRLGYTSGVYFHLLYFYNPNKNIPKGHHLSIIFYATAHDKHKLAGIREFLITSVLSNYYDFFCYEIAKDFSVEEEKLSNGTKMLVLKLTNIAGQVKKYGMGQVNIDEINKASEDVRNGKKTHVVCEVASDAETVLSFNRMPIDDKGRIILEKKFTYGAFLTKKDYYLPAQNRLNTDNAGEIKLYSIMEWEPCETGRLYNVLKLMEGYNQSAVLRIDIFPVEHTQSIRQLLPYAETRRRISDRTQGKDDNSETIIKSWDKYLNNLMKYPQFLANVVAFADIQDVAVMLADSVAAEAVESGTYLIETINNPNGFSMYESDTKGLFVEKEPGNFVAPMLSLYTLEEIRPMFSLPILYQGETVECAKETDPIFNGNFNNNKESISLGTSSMGYDVTFPIELFKKHAFIAGVPGAGKTNTMLYLVTTLWRDTHQHIPFLVLEPAKQEYRALAMIEGMEDLCVFSPGADTKFPLHINPFQFPVGLTLAEHIANLNAVFAGAFELIPPSPFLIDACIEKIYLDKGWNINERNDGSKEYPTMQELYDSLKIAVEESGYEGESKANIRSVMEVRIGSLLRREIGNVYNVKRSSMEPEDWLNCPVIIELEALGEGPANFMSLLISTLIREVLKIRKTSDAVRIESDKVKKEIEHIIFYEEAHNLIGPTTDDPIGGAVDPKISATKYLVKMLAEVRALGEGIVIADQLPTAMAPEVLKNTGLKLGHRITAQDDRNLLGSTMSASAEQLEEQGTFSTGQALIFYENLLKPFKMRVCEWEKGKTAKKYESPTNMQLFEHLKDNQIYNALLGRSASIMQEKMKVEFDVYKKQAEAAKEDITKKSKEIKITLEEIDLLKQKLISLPDEETKMQVNVSIAELTRVYEKKQRELDGKTARNLKKTCWGFSNLYYAYMTLSNNYSIYSEDMYMYTINNYLSFFDIIKLLHDVPDLQESILDETTDVISHLRRYVDLFFENEHSLLEHRFDYEMAIYKGGNYLSNYFDAKTTKFYKTADTINTDVENEKRFSEFGSDFSDCYFKMLHIAESYYNVCNALSSRYRNSLKDDFIEDTEEWREINSKVIELDEKKYALYKALVAYVTKVFRRLSGISGINRKVFLIKSTDLLASFRKIVDYRNSTTATVLSSWIGYSDVWRGTNPILILEMSAKFAHMSEEYLDITRANMKEHNNMSEKILKDYIVNGNAYFQIYANCKVNSFEYNCMLINYYVNFLERILKLGVYTHPILAKTSNGNWKICTKYIKELIKDERVSLEKRSSWNDLSVVMRSIFE